MKPKIIFLESQYKFSAGNKNRVEKIINETEKRAADLLKINWQINFVLYPYTSNPLMPSHGGIHAIDWIEVLIPSNFSDWTLTEIRGIICHEMHHAARGIYQYNSNSTHSLKEIVFSEGMAMSFESEFIPGFISRGAAYNPQEIEKILPLIKEQGDYLEYNHSWWFKGFQSPGYGVGKYFMDLIFKQNPYLNSAILVRTLVAELENILFKSSGINIKARPKT